MPGRPTARKAPRPGTARARWQGAPGALPRPACARRASATPRRPPTDLSHRDHPRTPAAGGPRRPGRKKACQGCKPVGRLAQGRAAAGRIPIGGGAAVQFNWILSGVLRPQALGLPSRPCRRSTPDRILNVMWPRRLYGVRRLTSGNPGGSARWWPHNVASASDRMRPGLLRLSENVLATTPDPDHIGQQPPAFPGNR